MNCFQRPFLLVLALFLSVCQSFTFGKEPPGYRLNSPDGRVTLKIQINREGRLTAQVFRVDEPVLEPSSLGITINGADLGENVRTGEFERYEIDRSHPWRGKTDRLRNHCRGAHLTLNHKPTGMTWTLELRAYNDGVAWRYIVPGEGERTVNGEATAYKLPRDTALWYAPYDRRYEGVYRSVSPDKKDGGFHAGPPVTAELPDGGYALINEAAILGYSGSTLKKKEGRKLHVQFPDDPSGWSMEGKVTSSWRMIVVADDLNELAGSHLPLKLAPPPDQDLFPNGIRTEWIKPGRSFWTWYVHDEEGAEWKRQKTYVDQAARLNCDYHLVDAGWEANHLGWTKGNRSKWDRVEELCRYGERKNVGIWIWRSVRGNRNSSRLQTARQRERFFRRCKEAGVAGVKIDTLNSESHKYLSIYRDILRKAARHEIMVNFHGAYPPAGERRTWPNEMTREGLRAMEWLKPHVGGEHKIPPRHFAALPFTRFVVGHGDITPGVFRKEFLQTTTAPMQLASSVVFYSPLLCWSDTFDVYRESPVTDLVRSVPVTWDASRVLKGSEIGTVAAIARRKGSTWWIGIVNGEKTEQTFPLKTEFLGSGRYNATLVGDVPGRPDKFDVRKRTFRAGETVSVKLMPGGGFLARLRAE